MDLVINKEELAELCGLSHLQQLTYLRGIRPYMDIKTGLAGIKRRISYQSIAEQLYVEPHQGAKCQSFSRDQVRRAVAGLFRAGIISVQSEGLQLILKCELVTAHYCVQNKAAINPPQNAATNQPYKILVDIGLSSVKPLKADIAETSKAAIPHKDNNYIYLLSQFEQFWSLYPEKKSRQQAWTAFQQLNPDKTLLNKMLEALEQQIKNHNAMQLQGVWVPPWKYPANWLAKQCWNDEIPMKKPQLETRRATHKKHTGTADPFCIPEDSEDIPTKNNVIAFQR